MTVACSLYGCKNLIFILLSKKKRKENLISTQASTGLIQNCYLNPKLDSKLSDMFKECKDVHFKEEILWAIKKFNKKSKN